MSYIVHSFSEKYIIYFRNKNQPVLDVLVKEGIPIAIDDKSGVEIDKRANELPSEIATILDKKMQERGPS